VSLTLGCDPLGMTADSKKAVQPLIHGLLATAMAACCAVFTYAASLAYMPAELLDRGFGGGGILAMLGALGCGVVSFAVSFLAFMIHGGPGVPCIVVRRWAYCLVLGNGVLFFLFIWLAARPAPPVGF
jgi:hypothetical protein